MESAGFDVGQWTHWLLVIGFVGIASYGLWLSWQWRNERRQRQVQAFRTSVSRFSRRRPRKTANKGKSQRRLARQLAAQTYAQQQNRHVP